MSYSNEFLHVLGHVAPIIRFQSSGDNSMGGCAIGIGANDFVMRKRLLKKHGVNTIPEEMLRDHAVKSGEEFCKSSKNLSSLFFKHFGYDSYVDLDIYDRADIVFDLSGPIPQELCQRFDLVIDFSSVYVTNIIQAFSNTSKMTKIGGKKIVVATLGDQTNRFELNPSPNFLIDFHVNNGFQLETAFLMNRGGKVLPYRRYRGKQTPIRSILPLGLLVVYVIKLFLTEMIFARPMIKRTPFIEYGKPENGNAGCTSSPSPAVGDLTTEVSRRERVRKFLKARLSSSQLARIRRLRLRMRYDFWWKLFEIIAPGWRVWILLRKTEETDDFRFHITSHYRHFDQSKAVSESGKEEMQLVNRGNV